MKRIKLLTPTLLFVGLMASAATPSYAQNSDLRAKSLSTKPTALAATAPCANPYEPCPGAGEIFKLNVKELRSQRVSDRDIKKHVMARMKESHPKMTPEMLEGNSGLIIALLAATKDVSDVEDIEFETIAWPPKASASIELKLKFTFGK